MGGEAFALESVEEAVAFDRVFAGHGRRGRGLAGSGDGENVWNVEAESGGVAVRRKVCEREPS